ncbi:THAP domain containing 12a [Melanotaenia boesemani]|uniref:THAP domain containing 12a n=1 Tax=Melanotaenia boesemani TaxID=1250792 RepID=UPI001C05795E|nr:THAP domain containing 12a [Melanotaenia boesemani]
MQNYCAVPNCHSGKSDSQPLFRFPHDPERSKKWLEKCQRKDLMDKSSEQLYKYYRLCGKHFETNAFDNDTQGKVLKDDAEPTVFDVTTQPQSGLVKRSKDTTKDDESQSKGRKKTKKSQPEGVTEDIQMEPEEDEQKKYVKALFEVVLFLGEQSIPPTWPADNEEEQLMSSTFQALLDYRMQCGDQVLKKRYAESKQCCSSQELTQLIEVCEKHVRCKVVEEVKQNGFFSLVTDHLVKISGEWCLPVFLFYVDQSKCQQERFVGFLSLEGDRDTLTEKMLSEMTDKWGLDMERCRGQAHSCSGTHFSQIKAFAAKLVEKYPRAVLTLRSTHALNVSLASGIALSGVQLVMSTFKKIESFFFQSPLLQLELEHAISMFYPDKEDKANELKEICRTSWTAGHEAFEVALDIIEALLLCVDSVHDNEDMRWNDQIIHNALEISKALADFELIMTLVVLKNVTTLTQAFGKNLQGNAADAYLAASSLKAVLHSLMEVDDNIDVYHEFWYDEAVNLAAAMEVPVKVPRSFLRKHQAESGAIQPENYYKEHLSVPVVKYIVSEMKELFYEDHLKTLRCLSLVPAVIELYKSTQPDEGNIQLFNNDIPNAGTLSAELHCWWVKWSKKGKGETFPSSLHETLQLADVKFFPNMLAILRLLSVMPSLASKNSCDVTHRRFKMYMENTPDKFKSKSLAVLNINYDVESDLDAVVDIYMKTYPDRQEVPLLSDV